MLENKKRKVYKKKKMSKIAFNFLGFLLMGLLSGGLVGYFSGEKIFEKRLEKLEDFQKNITSEIDLSENHSIEKEDQSVVNIVKENSPAVVSIIVTKNIPKIESFFNDPFLKQFYQEQQPETETESHKIGEGTGFVVDPSGFIITNKHVVNDEKANYSVLLSTGESKEAEVLAKDSYLDVAILKIEGENIPTVKLGDSDNLDIGQTVLAIGNSLGEFNNTVSRGIISGLKRQVEAGNSLGQTEILEEVIQTDAAINPGNSGGPLFDLKGKVIGINVAMAQGAENIGFTIPINQIKDIYQSVKENGKIVRPYLGVRYLVVNEKIKKINALKVDYGALILRGNSRSELPILPGSPADKAGLVEYDIILEIDGEKITEENNLAKILRKKKVGEKVKLKVLSKDKEKELEVLLEEADF